MEGRIKRYRKFSKTSTSSFGSRGRVNHDSSPFYSRKLYCDKVIPKPEGYFENTIPENILDSIINKSSEDMSELPDSSVHLVVTSPPYNVGKEYDEDLSLDEYREFLRRVWKEVMRVLVYGGRLCINMANIGRKPYIPLSSYITIDLVDIGFLPRGEVVWNKGNANLSSTAWGSWLSAKNPVIRDLHEYILVFSKGTLSRESLGRKSTISRDEFLEFTKSIWSFPPESAKRVGHPAPFPIELPYRLIQLYTFEGEVVLDPFIGSGQTAIAALKAKRHYVGYEINKEYVYLARKRIERVTSGNLFEQNWKDHFR